MKPTMRVECACLAYMVEPGAAFYGEGGSVHMERRCSDWNGAMLGKLEILVRRSWVEVSNYIFRSWAGERKKDGAPHYGPVYLVGSEEVFKDTRLGRMRGELESGPDDRGRYHYTLSWWADYHPGHPDGENRMAERSQHFFGIPSASVLEWKDARK